MKGVIPGVNVKVFGRAVHALSRIGEELYFEPLEHGLALRTVNSSRSAYGCFLFAPSFFLQYDDGSGHVNSADAADTLVRCKIAMKPCLGVFKSLSLLEKSVESCSTSLDMEQARLTFRLHCRHGIVKTYNLAFIECETLQAIFSKELCPNQLLAQSRLLCDVVANFQTNQEEISFIVNHDQICIRNFVDDEIDPSKVIRTGLTVNSDEFDRYSVTQDTEVTFCLKELRAILGFTESINLPVSIHFESPSKPIIFSFDSDPSFEGSFVLATLADDITSEPTSSQQVQQNTCDISTANRTEVMNGRSEHSTEPRLKKVHTAAGDGEDRIIDRRNPNIASTSTKSDAVCQDLVNNAPCNVPSVTSRDFGYVTSNSDITAATTSVNGTTCHKQTQMDEPDHDIDHEPTTLTEEGDGQDLLVPGTPPSKKFKSLFYGLSQSTTSGSQPLPAPLVLAEDTDEDD